ncbi:hypothetical protein [Aurantimonas sp. 22II-16-19i]|nr:hypothetical protein [Aurantimonas sp. 22II-16-19i]
MTARRLVDAGALTSAALLLLAGLAVGNARLAATDRAGQEAFASIRGIGR